MISPRIDDLDPAALDRRLHDLAGDERRVQVEFLLHLDEFDRRRAYLDLGFGSLWEYCLTELHLREGAAGRRIGAMRVLRRFSALEAPLRDGRLCLSTAALLGQVLTEENREELVAQVAFRTKAEVEQLVASIRPRVAPRDGIRRVPDAAPAMPALELPPVSAEVTPGAAIDVIAGVAQAESVPACRVAPAAIAAGSAEPRRRARIESVSGDRWSLRVTLDPSLRSDLDTLRAMLSHKLPDGDLTEVLREAVRCAIEKHGKRKGSVAPAQERVPEEPAPQKKSPRAVPASVRRQVWARDGGRCTFVAADARRCESRWQLELDHVDPAALGGAPTLENLRLRCRPHNLHHAEDVFGREHMARFRRGSRLARRGGTSTGERRPRTGEPAIAGDSELAAPRSGAAPAEPDR